MDILARYKLTGDDSGGGRASRSSGVLRVLRLLGNRWNALVASAGRSIALGALSGIVGVVHSLAGRVGRGGVHGGCSRVDTR